MTEEGIRIYMSMTAGDKEKFKVASRKLMSQCMLVRDKSPSMREDYIFLANADRFRLLQETMELHGYEVAIDRDNGVIRYYVGGDTQENRYRLNIRDKIVLCVLVKLYAEKLDSRHLLDRFIEVQLSDVIDVIEKFRLKDRFSGTAVKDSLSLLARFNLIGTGPVKDMAPSSPVRIYPSIQFCLDEPGVKAFIDSAQALLEDEGRREEKRKTAELAEALREDADEEE